MQIEYIKDTFKYNPHNEEEILIRANDLRGLTIADICKSSPFDKKELNIKNKGNVGNLIEEHWFGIKNNNSPLPDFNYVGIELKVIPLIQNKDKSLSVKDRTKICSLDYNKLIEEEWSTSHAKVKLNKILFVYYLYDKENIINSQIKKIDLFKLNGHDEQIIRKDWLGVYNLVKEGESHSISETISNILAASRSGSGGTKADGTQKDLVSQPNNELKALKRAFSLKQSFTNQRWKELNNNCYESILEILNTSAINFEKELLNKLFEFKGKTLGDIAKIFNIKVPTGKNGAATIVKKAIGFKNVISKIKEFEQLGITVKTISIRPDNLKPWEAVSFPSFKLKELVQERF